MRFVAKTDERPDERTDCEPTMMPAKPYPAARQYQGGDHSNLRCEVLECRRQILIKELAICRVNPGTLHCPVIDEIRSAVY